MKKLKASTAYYNPIEAAQVESKPEPLPVKTSRKGGQTDPFSGWSVEKRVRVTEDWWPTADDGTVSVKILRMISYRSRGRQVPGGWRVCLWGEDDFGMEQDFDDDNFEQARRFYNLIDDGITQEQLHGMGFTIA